MGHLHKNTLYMEGKEGGGCLLDGNVFLKLKSVCNKISDFNIRNLILLVCLVHIRSQSGRKPVSCSSYIS